jgi:adenine-specific DNA-methyltransferase
MFDLRLGDCLEVMADIPDNSVDLILTDPPYFKVKNEAWDKQWDRPDQFLAWLDTIVEQFQRILKPNGSLYLFASPKMSARVETLIARRMNVLNNIRWTKDAGWHRGSCKDSFRSYFPAWEAVIFAEHYGADNIAKGEAGYLAKCDELRGFIFEPLRAYLDGERERAGFTVRQVAEAFQVKTGSRTVTGMAGHWFSSVQWTLPTRENYEWLRALLDGEYLRKDYEELRKDYEELRKDYEELRRPFAVTADVHYTDTWTFDTVKPYPGKHPCEKPQAMLRHIITASSKPGAVVFDAFAGTGSTGMAALSTGRRFIGCDMSPEYIEIARQRIEQAHQSVA